MTSVALRRSRVATPVNSPVCWSSPVSSNSSRMFCTPSSSPCASATLSCSTIRYTQDADEVTDAEARLPLGGQVIDDVVLPGQLVAADLGGLAQAAELGFEDGPYRIAPKPVKDEEVGDAGEELFAHTGGADLALHRLHVGDGQQGAGALVEADLLLIVDAAGVGGEDDERAAEVRGCYRRCPRSGPYR